MTHYILLVLKTEHLWYHTYLATVVASRLLMSLYDLLPQVITKEETQAKLTGHAMIWVR